jgi:hypothetical protein
MFEHRLLQQIDRRLERLEELVEILLILQGGTVPLRSPPAAPLLAGSFDFSGDTFMTTATLIATIPTTRSDGTALAPTDIASITYQKTSLLPDGVTAGPQLVLQTNTATVGIGLALADLTFADSASLPGDSYTCFVTDTAGDAGALSNAVVNVIVVKPSAPSAPVLSGTFA